MKRNNNKEQSPILSPRKIAAFRKKVWSCYQRHKRYLPFRETDDPYAITVSEIMLQQTQVSRVVDKYTNWLHHLPEWESLAHASNRRVLSLWSGLGYNRRALYLKEIAKIVLSRYNGTLPDNPSELQTLPGIGPYTAHAIAAFAFQKRVAAVDTNVRKVIIYSFGLSPTISPAAIQKLATQLLPRKHIKEWHYALMDYARFELPSKISQIVPPVSRQSRFDGSLRQVRGEIIRELTKRTYMRVDTLTRQLARPAKKIHTAVESLVRDGLIIATSRTIRLKE